MLEVTDLSGGYGHIRILWNISLHIERGEIVTLLGANGAGKTTLIRMLAGELRPTEGSIVFLEEDITPAPAHAIVEAGLVEIPEGRQLWAGLSIEDNLDLGAFCRHARTNLKATKDWVYSLFPVLAERRAAKARTLSGGQQQMLAIGRALMSKPKLLMLDEPSLGLAPQIVAELFKILVTINDQGITVLLVEQNVDFALRIADRAYVLEHGRMTQQGHASELLKNNNIRAAYLGI
jgi:branched-chain amino acid transport system ATP-binding protein